MEKPIRIYLQSIAGELTPEGIACLHRVLMTHLEKVHFSFFGHVSTDSARQAAEIVAPQGAYFNIVTGTGMTLGEVYNLLRPGENAFVVVDNSFVDRHPALLPGSGKWDMSGMKMGDVLVIEYEDKSELSIIPTITGYLSAPAPFVTATAE